MCSPTVCSLPLIWSLLRFHVLLWYWPWKEEFRLFLYLLPIRLTTLGALLTQSHPSFRLQRHTGPSFHYNDSSGDGWWHCTQAVHVCDCSVRGMWEERHRARCGRFSCSSRYVWEDTVESGSCGTVDAVEYWNDFMFPFSIQMYKCELEKGSEWASRGPSMPTMSGCWWVKFSVCRRIHICTFSCRSVQLVQWRTQHVHLLYAVGICPTLIYSREGPLQAHLQN